MLLHIMASAQIETNDIYRHVYRRRLKQNILPKDRDQEHMNITNHAAQVTRRLKILRATTNLRKQLHFGTAVNSQSYRAIAQYPIETIPAFGLHVEVSTVEDKPRRNWFLSLLSQSFQLLQFLPQIRRHL